MNYKIFSAVFGFSVWLMATLSFSFWGDVFFLTDNTAILAAFFLSTIPSLYFMSKWVFEKYKLSAQERLESAVLMAIPGMLCDVVCLKFHSLIFPKLTMEQAVVLGAWIVWAYVVVLLIGVLQGNSNRATS